jgi:hypothetical protein
VALFVEPKASLPIIGLASREEKEEFRPVNDINRTLRDKENTLEK